ncbi:unnamed protein product [Haemonchus placei]|uniref:Uncharacterized protein n=1 Tax=Haemonchus placei TaxID=6290 RepID=A0A0N4X580_HAEPC|nr:unnamed protein product [Haemonchus placei]
MNICNLCSVQSEGGAVANCTLSRKQGQGNETWLGSRSGQPRLSHLDGNLVNLGDSFDFMSHLRGGQSMCKIGSLRFTKSRSKVGKIEDQWTSLLGSLNATFLTNLS